MTWICPRCGYPNDERNTFCIKCGNPQDAGYVASFMPPASPDAMNMANVSEPQSPQPDAAMVPGDAVGDAGGKAAARPRRNWIMPAVIIVLVVAAIIVASGVGWHFVSDPSHIIDRYLTAIQEGRFADAARMDGADDELDDNQRKLLTDDIIPQETSRLHDYSVAPRLIGNDQRQYTVTYTVGGVSQAYTLTLAQESAGPGLKRWRLKDSLRGSISVCDNARFSDPSGTLVTSITVNGIALTDADSLEGDKDTTSDPSSPDFSTCRSFVAYPGVYTFDASIGESSNPYLEETIDSTATTVDGPNSGGLISTKRAFTDALYTEVNRQVAELYAGCVDAANAGRQPDAACGLPWPWEHAGDPDYTNSRYSMATVGKVTDQGLVEDILQNEDTGDASATFQMTATYRYEWDRQGTGAHESEDTDVSNTCDVNAGEDGVELRCWGY